MSLFQMLRQAILAREFLIAMIALMLNLQVDA